MAANKADPVIQELRHEPVPGYAKVFLIAAAAAIAYLALILVSSPGKVKKNHGKEPAASTHSSPIQSDAKP